jgi:hypothetical protein
MGSQAAQPVSRRNPAPGPDHGESICALAQADVFYRFWIGTHDEYERPIALY